MQLTSHAYEIGIGFGITLQSSVKVGEMNHRDCAFPYQIIIISIFQIEHLHFHNQINLFAIKYSIQFPKSEAIKFVF